MSRGTFLITAATGFTGGVAIDHQNGVFAGTNDVVKRIGGRQPTTLEEFIIKHRKAFA